ncbi:MAG: flavodoxin family protein [Thermodesulfobacteriota bacterium]|nr:flavodoxin family protein [Thermodesulfobacteriota bacterium]
MNIVGIGGSPRNGNTEAILSMLLQNLKDLGAETELILLRKTKMDYCDSCHKCFGKQKCQKADDVSEIIHPKILAADVLIFGSPSHYGSVSGQMKTFMDRCLPFLNMYIPGLLRGKYALNILAYGRGGGTHIAQATLNQWCMCLGMHVFDNLSYKALDKDDAKKNENIRARLRLTAEELFNATDLRLKGEGDRTYPIIIANERALTDKWK